MLRIVLLNREKKEVAEFTVVDEKQKRDLAEATCVKVNDRYFSYHVMRHARMTIEFIECNPPLEIVR